MIKQNQTLLNRLNVLLDGMLLVLALVMSYFIRFRFFVGVDGALEIGVYLCYFLPFIPFQLLAYGFGGLYASGRRQALTKSLVLIALVNTSAFVIELSGMYLFKLLDLSRLALGFYYLMGLLFVGGKHVLTRKVLERLRAEGHNLKHVVIVGSGPNALSYTPKNPCRYPGCPNLCERGVYCEAHAEFAPDRLRGGAQARGYDKRWRRARALFLKRHPLCAECIKRRCGF